MPQNHTPSPEEKIRRTIAEYCHFTDLGDFESWLDLFTPTGSFRMFGETYAGREVLRAFIADDQKPELRGLHVTSDSIIEIDGDIAKVRSNFVFYADGDTAGVVVAKGRYLDVLVPRGDRWLFEDREAVLLGPVATQRWGSRKD